MSDEFDELLDRPLRAGAASPVTASQSSASRLVARLYVAADGPLRARLLASLIRRMGPLGIAGIAAGAFAWALQRGVALAGAAVDVDRAARVSGDQVAELARFAEQVDPQALQDFAALIEGSPLGLAGFSAAALLLLYRVMQARPQSPVTPSAPARRPPRLPPPATPG